MPRVPEASPIDVVALLRTVAGPHNGFAVLPGTYDFKFEGLISERIRIVVTHGESPNLDPDTPNGSRIGRPYMVNDPALVPLHAELTALVDKGKNEISAYMAIKGETYEIVFRPVSP